MVISAVGYAEVNHSVLATGPLNGAAVWGRCEWAVGPRHGHRKNYQSC